MKGASGKLLIDISEILIMLGDKSSAKKILDSNLYSLSMQDHVEHFIITYEKISRNELLSKVYPKLVSNIDNRLRPSAKKLNKYLGNDPNKALIRAAIGFYSVDMPTQAKGMLSKITFYRNDNVYGFYDLERLIELGYIEEAKNIVKNFYHKDRVPYSLAKLAKGYAEKGEFEKAHKMVEILLSDKSNISSSVAYKDAIRNISTVHIQNDNPKLALETMELIDKRHLRIEDIKIFHAISELFAISNDIPQLKHTFSLMLEILHHNAIFSEWLPKPHVMLENLTLFNEVVKKNNIELDSKDKSLLHEIVYNYKYQPPIKEAIGDNIPGLSNEETQRLCKEACKRIYSKGTKEYNQCVYCCTNKCE